MKNISVLQWLKIAGLLISIFSPLTSRSQKTLLCLQENASVYYETFKRGEEGDFEKWEILLQVENGIGENLFYAGAGKNFSTDAPTIIPPYVTIKIINAKETGLLADEMFYLRGRITLHLTADGTSIFRVNHKTEQTFSVLVKKGEGVILEGRFNTTLLPLDKMNILKLR